MSLKSSPSSSSLYVMHKFSRFSFVYFQQNHFQNSCQMAFVYFPIRTLVLIWNRAYRRAHEMGIPVRLCEEITINGLCPNFKRFLKLYSFYSFIMQCNSLIKIIVFIDRAVHTVAMRRLKPNKHETKIPLSITLEQLS